MPTLEPKFDRRSVKEFLKMRKFVLSSFSLIVAGLLLVSIQVRAAGTSKADDPVRICQEGCKVHKDNESYEACMLKCKDTHKSKAPAASITPAKKK